MDPGIEAQKAYYDRRWSGEDAANPFELRRAAAILDLLAEAGTRRPRILDLGCGRGWLAGILSAFGPTTAIDLSEAGVAAARRRWPAVDFRAGDFFEAPPEAGAHDVVVSQEVIEHVEAQADYLDLAADCLAPGGWLVLTTPNRRVLERFAAAELRHWGLQPVEKWLDARELRGLLARRFDVRSLRTIIPGVGSRGVLLLLNSRKVRVALGALGLGALFDAARCRLGFGLHLAVLARLRGPA